MKLSKGWAIVFVFGSLALILGLAYGATLPNLPHLAHLPMALVAWGTLMLALATFQMITNSNEQEKRRREEGLLKEIIEWAENISICGLDVESRFQSVAMSEPLTDEKVIRAQAYLWDSASNLQGRFLTLRIKGEYVKKIAPTCGGDLHTKTTELINQLEEHNKLLDLYISAIPGGIPRPPDLNKQTEIVSGHAKPAREGHLKSGQLR